MRQSEDSQRRLSRKEFVFAGLPRTVSIGRLEILRLAETLDKNDNYVLVQVTSKCTSPHLCYDPITVHIRKMVSDKFEFDVTGIKEDLSLTAQAVIQVQWLNN